MNFFTSALFSLSIGIGAIIGGIRIKKIDPAFFPFIFLTWAAFVNESISITLMYRGYSNAVVYNLFTLGEALLACWQFYRWKLFATNKKLYLSVQGLFLCWWLIERVIAPTNSFSSYFVVLYSFVFVLMSISCINRLVFTESTTLLRNPIFLICLSFILYFTFSVLVETFWIFGLQRSRSFRLRMQEILTYINLFTNLVFALALLWMPMRHRYILQY